MVAYTPRLGVAALITDKEDRLLLGRRGKEPNYGKWVLPGGRVEWGEHWMAALHREVKEETGLEFKPWVDWHERILPWVMEIITDTEHRVILCVTGHVTGGELKASSDLLEARFFARSQIPEDVSDAIKPTLQRFGWIS